MKITFLYILILGILACKEKDNEPEIIITDPPFNGTIFVDPNIIVESDPTALESVTSTGLGERTVYDRRTASFNLINAYLFNVKYNDGYEIEFQVNEEFDNEYDALAVVNKYAGAIGRIPSVLRKDAETVTIHQGINPFGGGNRNILIHDGQGDLYIQDGILEETLVHEASHTSLDAEHATSEGWVLAQEKDPAFISTYARDNPQREDIAETYLMYLAVRFRADRISRNNKDLIEKAVPNRLLYFDNQNFNIYPME